jgi:hypothetical protein
MTAQCWSDIQLAYTTCYSLFQTRLRGKLLDCVVQTVSLTRWPVFPGSAFLGRVQAVWTFRALNGLSLGYQSSVLRRPVDIPSSRRLRSAAYDRLDVLSSLLKIIGDRVFAVAGLKLWNGLPGDFVNCQSHPVYHRTLFIYCFFCLHLQ